MLQFQSDLEKEKKREANRLDYLKHRDQRLKRARDYRRKKRQENVIDLPGQLSFEFKESSTERGIIWNSAINILKQLPQILVILVGTAYLVVENQTFYSNNDTQSFPALLKALLAEGMLLTLVFQLKGVKSLASKTFIGFAVALLVVYSSLGFSSHIFKSKMGAIQSLDQKKVRILELKADIKSLKADKKGRDQRGEVAYSFQIQKNIERKERELEGLFKAKAQSTVIEGKTDHLILLALLIFRVSVQLVVLFLSHSLNLKVER